MLSKKKLAALTAGGLLTVGLLVGGASFALFSDTATNNGNDFVAGSLELETNRNDTPIEGPMFYVNDNDNGRMGTGIWAPLDSHSRSMFIENTGSLDGKITKLIAEIESGNKATDFAEQALVTVAVYETDGVAIDATLAREINDVADGVFKDLMDSIWTRWAGRLEQEIAAAVREAVLNLEFDVDNNGNSIRVGVSDVYVGSLADMLNNGVAADLEVELPAGQTMQLGYTVSLMDDKGKDFDNNDIKNVTAKFKFTNVFEQVRNNN